MHVEFFYICVARATHARSSGVASNARASPLRALRRSTEQKKQIMATVKYILHDSNLLINLRRLRLASYRHTEL